MSPCAGLHTQLAAVMESLVHAAVAELKKLVEDSSAFVLRLEVRAGEKLPPPVTLQAESREKMVQFAAVMETLGNEALGKIMNVVEEAKLLLEPETTKRRGSKRPQTSILYILNNTCTGAEHSSGARPETSSTHRSTQTKQEQEEPEKPFVPAVTIKDEHGNVDLCAITHRSESVLTPRHKPGDLDDLQPLDLQGSASMEVPHVRSRHSPSIRAT
ncbi:hypothetical protein PFLUV_G00238900 [Perca fluviatilis]|uniref:Uncharacterized protein n=1 Tax=Perca fluviatilis TaxID=8168 RepID=A0A6A5EHP5_PERFL|nr:hypothetical protein PFLUV_G00238900 [Perca fluviatilis]